MSNSGPRLGLRGRTIRVALELDQGFRLHLNLSKYRQYQVSPRQSSHSLPLCRICEVCCSFRLKIPSPLPSSSIASTFSFLFGIKLLAMLFSALLGSCCSARLKQESSHSISECLPAVVEIPLNSHMYTIVAKFSDERKSVH
jgi:hypothetical protein